MRGSGLVLGGYMVLRCLAPAEAAAGGANPADIALECRLPEQAGALTQQMLCAAMTGSLEAAAPGQRIALRTGGGARALVVAVTGTGPRGLSGHLMWGSAAGAGLQSGPVVQFRLVDAALDAGKLRGFTDALLASDPRILPALRGAAE